VCNHINYKGREMKKSIFFVGIIGMLFVVSGVDAAISPITTNRVRKSMYDVTYGSAASADLDDYSYRKGYKPQKKELETAVGADVATTLNNVTVGNLASVSNTSNGTVSSAAVDSTHTPTETVKANSANIDVLERDKLVRPATNNCDTNEKCGYVTVGNGGENGGNNTANKVWMEIR